MSLLPRLLVLLAIVLTVPAQAAEPIGQVLYQRGDATVDRDGATLPLAAGAPIHARDTVTTAGDGRLKIRLDDGTVFSVAGGTSVTVADRAAPDRERLSLTDGLVRAVVDPGTPFTVTTPTAVAAVRGTDWMIEADDANTTAVFVFTGTVTVRAAGRPDDQVVLTEGGGTDVAAGAAPTAPMLWGQARIDRFLARLAP